MNTLGGRKFALVVGILISATLLQWFGKIGDGQTYATIVIGVIAAYIAGNVTQKVKAP